MFKRYAIISSVIKYIQHITFYFVGEINSNVYVGFLYYVDNFFSQLKCLTNTYISGDSAKPQLKNFFTSNANFDSYAMGKARERTGKIGKVYPYKLK